MRDSASFSQRVGTLRKTSRQRRQRGRRQRPSTGTLSAASGDLQFDGPSNVISGTLSGAGQISFGGGVTTLWAVTASAGTIGIYNAATVDLAANLAVGGAFADSSDGVSTLNLGAHNLSLNGASAAIIGSFGTANVTGSGTLTNNSVLTLGTAILGGTVKLSNAKTINQVGQVTVGDGLGGAPSIANTSTGTYDFTDDAGLGLNNATSTFTNQGLLEKTGGVAGQSSVISMAVTSSGTISAQVGALNFNGSLVNTGTISGAGTVEVTGSGSITLEFRRRRS